MYNNYVIANDVMLLKIFNAIWVITSYLMIFLLVVILDSDASKYFLVHTLFDFQWF